MMTLTLKNTVASVLYFGEHTPIVRVVVLRPQWSLLPQTLGPRAVSENPRLHADHVTSAVHAETGTISNPLLCSFL